MDEWNDIRRMTLRDFELFGADSVAYIRATVIDGETLFVVSDAAGRQLGVAPDYETAFNATVEHDFEPVSVH